MNESPHRDGNSEPGVQPRSPLPFAETALVHLYRGELGRLTAYRRRLDTTTNWAISVSGTAVTLALGADTIPHVVALLALLPALAFLLLEAGRFREYEASRMRVEIFERGYFPDELRGNTEWRWIEPLIAQLQDSRPPLDRVTAVGLRLRRTYLWIFLVIFGSWLLKLELTGGPSGDLGSLVRRASVGALPGWAVLVGVLIFVGVLVWLALTAPRRYPRAGDW